MSPPLQSSQDKTPRKTPSKNPRKTPSKNPCKTPSKSSQDKPSSSSQSSQEKPSNTRDIKAYPLTMKEEDIMIELLENTPAVWNTKCMDFKNSQKKICLWDKQARDMGKPVEHIKQW